MTRTNHNQDYQTLNPQDKATFLLLHFFPGNFYDLLLEFLGSKPTFNPPHIQDIRGEKNGLFNSSGLIVKDLIEINKYMNEDINLETYVDPLAYDQRWTFVDNVYWRTPHTTLVLLHDHSWKLSLCF